MVSLFNKTAQTGLGYSFLRQFPIFIIYFYVFSKEILKGNLGIKQIMQWFIAGVTILVILYFFNIDVSRSQAGRISIAGVGANSIATYCNISFMFIISLMDKHQIGKRTRWFYILMIPLILYINLLTGSRGGFLGLLLGIFIYYYFRSTDFIKRFNYVGTGVIIVGVIGIVFLSNDMLYERFFQDDASLTDSRLPLWLDVFSIVKGNLIFGVGLFRYQAEIIALRGTYFATHNAYLAILVYGGLLGLSLFLLLLYMSFKSAYQVSRIHRDPLFLSLVAMIFLVLLKGGGSFLSLTTWFIIAVVFASKYIYPDQNAQQDIQ